MWAFARANDIENKLKALDRNIALQGEIIGEGIQSNKYKLRGQTVTFFNVFDIDAFKYVDFQEFTDVIKSLGLTTVPILETDYVLTNDIPTLVNKSIGKSVLKNDVHREGIVIRPLNELRDRDGRVSFKSINPDFLLKFQD